jgi:hypothetical protein
MVLMRSTSELLLHDARENLSRQILTVSGKKDLDEAFVAWLLSEENSGVDLEGAAAVAAGHVGAERTYHDVAVLGFASAVIAINANQDTLNAGLKWLAGRTPFVDGLPTGVCVDAVALLGIALGGKHVRDEATRALIAAWIGSFIHKSYGMRNEEDWQKCLLASFVEHGSKGIHLPVHSANIYISAALCLATQTVIPVCTQVSNLEIPHSDRPKKLLEVFQVRFINTGVSYPKQFVARVVVLRLTIFRFLTVLRQLLKRHFIRLDGDLSTFDIFILKVLPLPLSLAWR